MTDAARFERNRTMLTECERSFRTALASVLMQLQGEGFRPRIQCAWRSLEDQQAAYLSGTSHVLFGFHNVTAPDGTPQALAADVLDDDHPLNPSRPYLLALTRYARKAGLDTGLTWDLPANIRIALNIALATGQPWDGKVGWDSCHVETTAVTVEDAKAGKRPKAGASQPTMNA